MQPLLPPPPPHTDSLIPPPSHLPLSLIYYHLHSGMGPAIRPDDGLFLTWHFSLFSSLFNRLKRSSRRTRDPSKAR